MPPSLAEQRMQSQGSSYFVHKMRTPIIEADMGAANAPGPRLGPSSGSFQREAFLSPFARTPVLVAPAADNLTANGRTSVASLSPVSEIGRRVHCTGSKFHIY